MLEDTSMDDDPRTLFEEVPRSGVLPRADAVLDTCLLHFSAFLSTPFFFVPEEVPSRFEVDGRSTFVCFLPRPVVLSGFFFFPGGFESFPFFASPPRRTKVGTSPFAWSLEATVGDRNETTCYKTYKVLIEDKNSHRKSCTINAIIFDISPP
jgi:hypothetical protein